MQAIHAREEFALTKGIGISVFVHVVIMGKIVVKVSYFIIMQKNQAM